MGLAVLVLGFSGSGKSASMRDFGADELALVNVNGKPLPFRTKFRSVLRSDNYAEIADFIKKQTAKAIAVDDAQYLMANEFMRRSKENGYQKFTDMAKNFWELVRLAEALPDDVIVYFLSHIETGDDGRQKAKTIGKLLDEKICIEGMFTTVLKTVAVDGKYLFATQTDGTDTCKSPIGLFDSMYIDNNLKLVDESLRQYYGLTDEHKCTDCGSAIVSDGKRTVSQIIDGSIKNYGKKLCMECVMKRVDEAKANAAQTVSE
ncbi:MAG: AAA family ATPase [Ruminiclostridium sp.]|nr:AAA family ATPase [Ruminiclostridium sp.]